MDTKVGPFLDDAESLKALIDQLPPAGKELYQSYGALTLESGFPNRIMVVYTLSKGAPTGVEVLTLGDMEMTRIGGPTVTVSSDKQPPVTLSVHPRRWGDRDLFLHVPQNFIFKWKGKATPKRVEFIPHYAILIKTLSREHQQTDQHTYCVTLNNFRERFPKIAIRY